MTRHIIVHLSDTHLCPDGQLLHGRIDTWARTREALGAARHFSPDAVVVTGDIADRGAPIHPRAAELFSRAQRDLGCPVITIPGNHDPAGAIGPDFNTQRLSTGPHPANTVHEILGLRIIGLDSAGFQQAQGMLDAPQLQWLEGLLGAPAPDGTLILLHHPPVEAVAAERAGRGLADPAGLASLVAGSDVRAILCGHYHQPASSALLRISVFMAPAVSYNMNPFAPAEMLEEPGAGFQVLVLDAQQVACMPVSGAQWAELPAPRATEPAAPSGQGAPRGN